MVGCTAVLDSPAPDPSLSLQPSGLVSEVNAYVVLSLVAALVLLFTVYCTYIMANHVCRLLMAPQPGGPEQARLLGRGE